MVAIAQRGPPPCALTVGVAVRHLYLDQNKWIDLARAYHGRPGGARFRDALDTVDRLVCEGYLRVPLSSAHVMETARRGDRASRRRLAEVMIALSRGWVIAPTYTLTRGLAGHVAQSVFVDDPPAPQPLPFGRGIEFAFGNEFLASGRDLARADLLRRALDTLRIPRRF